MKDKRPQPTGVLISRLQRIAKHFDWEANEFRILWNAKALASHRAKANTCWQAAARLEDLLKQIGGRDVL